MVSSAGEPLVRKGVDHLVAQLKAIPGIRRVTMTTNGVLLAQQLLARGCTPAEAAVQAGYQDYSTFSRAYKKQFGRSPSADAEKEHDLQVTTQDL